jgi:hypothetical protein
VRKGYFPLQTKEDIMGKINLFTLLTAVITQFIVGYLWFGSHLFGDVMTAGGHGVDFLKLDVVSMLLLVLSGYGLTHVLGTLIKAMGVKDIGGITKLGLTVGGFAIGLPVTVLLNLMGFGHIVLLVIFTYLVLITILTGIVVMKTKNS